MNNGAHAATGLLAGAGFVMAIGFLGADVSPATYPVYAVACAGWALAPDLDHDNSMFTRSGGPVTRGLAEGLQWLARFTYRHTRREHDPPTNVNTGEHRGLLHTLLFPLLVVGPLVGLGSLLHPWVGPIVLAAVLSPALRSLAFSVQSFKSSKNGKPNRKRSAKYSRSRSRKQRLRFRKQLRRTFTRDLRSRVTWLLVAVGIAVVTVVSTDVSLSGSWFGTVTVLGMLVHTAGDGATLGGVPWLGGIPHRCDKHRKQQHHQPDGSSGKPARRCAMWDTKHNLPKRWIRRTGHWREKPIAGVCIAASAAVISIGVLGALGS